MCIRDRAMEGLNKKLDDHNKKLESWIEDNRKWKEERKDDGNPAIEEVPNDETMDELRLQSEDNGKHTENKEDSKALLPEDTHHRNEENIQHQEAIVKKVKNKIIKKTGEKETIIKGIIRPKKTRITKEILEMTRSGLIDVYKRQDTAWLFG